MQISCDDRIHWISHQPGSDRNRPTPPVFRHDRTHPLSPIEFARGKFRVRSKHSDRKSRVSVIGYCPNASPLLNHLTIRRNAPHLSLIYLVRYAIEGRTLLKPKESKVPISKSSEDHSLTFHKTVVSIDVSLMFGCSQVF